MRSSLRVENLIGMPFAEVGDILRKGWDEHSDGDTLVASSIADCIAFYVFPMRFAPSRFVVANIPGTRVRIVAMLTRPFLLKPF